MYIKTIKDYYELLYEKFPYLPKRDIQKIVNYGWRLFYLINSYGADVTSHEKDFTFYCGSLTKNSLNHFRYYLRKLLVKARIMYKRKCPEWDGYYYFALSEKQYIELLKQIHSTGRPRKYVHIDKMVFFKNYDECKIQGWNKIYIMRIPSLIDRGISFYKEDADIEVPELYEKRESIKFDSILTQNNNFKYI